MTRSRKILALVPKSRGKSDDESSESSEDEVKMCRNYPEASDDSSPVRSLASSVEHLNIFSDSDDCEYREIFTIAAVHEEPRSQHNTMDSTPNSPSILRNDPDIIPPSPSVYIPPSPSIDSDCSPAPAATVAARRRVGRSKKTRVLVKKTILKPTKIFPKWTNLKFLGAEIEDTGR